MSQQDSTQLLSKLQNTNISLLRAGLVFMAFGFNMVDCGGLLGGRLGNNNAAIKPVKAAKAERSYTL